MSYFDTSDGKNAADVGKEYDAGGGDMEPIPAKTQVLAAPDEAKWDGKQTAEGMDEYISVRWTVFKPDAYKNRKVFQKIRVEDPDDKKRDKAKRMLAAIDNNAGGVLQKLGTKPSDADLARALINKPMMLMLQVWKIKGENGDTMSGNWVSAVSSRDAAKPSKEPEQQKPAGADFDDEIPF